MVLIVPCQLLFLLISSGRRHWLRHRAPYLAFAIGIVLFSPVIYWNWQHDWFSFGFQLSQGFAVDDDPFFSKLGEYLGGQLGVVTPLLFLAFVVYSMKALTDISRQGHEIAIFLVCLSWPVLVFFGISTIVGDVAEANWPATAYLAGLLLAWTVFRRFYDNRRGHRRFMKAAIALGVLMNLVLHIHLINPIIPIAPADDNTRQFHGWRDLGRHLNAIVDNHPSDSGYFLIANRMTTVAEIVFYTGNRFTGLDLFGLEKYTFLPSLDELRGKDALIVVHHFSPHQLKNYAPFFDTLCVMGAKDFRFRGTVIDELSATILLGTHFKGVDSVRGY
jgi:hypothetical protein